MTYGQVVQEELKAQIELSEVQIDSEIQTVEFGDILFPVGPSIPSAHQEVITVLAQLHSDSSEEAHQKLKAITRAYRVKSLYRYLAFHQYPSEDPLG